MSDGAVLFCLALIPFAPSVIVQLLCCIFAKSRGAKCLPIFIIMALLIVGFALSPTNMSSPGSMLTFDNVQVFGAIAILAMLGVGFAWGIYGIIRLIRKIRRHG